MPKVVAVIPSLGRNIDRLNGAIGSIRNTSSELELQIVVVNNSPVDLTQKAVGADRILNPGLNLGYVGALEWVRQSLTSEYFWVVQDDMTLTNDVLGALLTRMEEDENLAVLSPLLVRDGIVPARTRAGVFIDSTKTTWENVPFADTAIEDWEQIHGLMFVSGSGALYRSTALAAVGGFDVSLFPLMHVDVDLCWRLTEAGYRIDLCPEAHIEHEIQGSTPRMLGELLFELNTKIVARKMARNAETTALPELSIDPEIVKKIATKAASLVIDLAQRGDAVVLERDSLIAERDSLMAERDEIRAHRDSLSAERDLLLASTSWRVTRPLRGLKNRVAMLRRRHK
jgi:GT2 family glycosyltransferase